MQHAELCPVCKGKGKVCDGISPNSTAPITKTCHGCNGTGWITVGVPDYYNYPYTTPGTSTPYYYPIETNAAKRSYN